MKLLMIGHIEKDFAQFYSNELHNENLIPRFITEQFEVNACLSTNEMKSIYLITHKQSGIQYILKQMTRMCTFQGETERDMLQSLNQPSIPKLLNWYNDEKYLYLIREYFDGISLESRVLGRGPLPINEICYIVEQVCDILSYLHQQTPPIIHRDIKPQNIILRPDGSIGLIDFDASRRHDRLAQKDTVYLGTVQTAAPEQFGYGQTDQHTDIYSLGILLIYLATGSYDRSGLTDMSPWLSSLAAKCTSFSPKDRYDTVNQVKKYLLKKNHTITHKKLIFTLCFLLCIGFLGVSFYIFNPFYESSEAQTSEITFQCARIEQAVRDALGKTIDEPLSQEELGRITQLNIIGDLPTSITAGDIQHDYNGNLIRYRDVSVKRGTINSLVDLNRLPNLSEVTLIYQQITNLTGIEDLHLLRLNISYNDVTDLSLLGNMTSLNSLIVICNPVKDVTPLAKLSNLQYLQLCGTQVKDLSPLSSLQSLTLLDLFGMKGIDISPLSSLKNLNIVQ